MVLADWPVPDPAPIRLSTQDTAPADVVGIDLMEQIRQLSDDLLLHIHDLTTPGRNKFRDRERHVSRAQELHETAAGIEQTAGRLIRAMRRDGLLSDVGV